MLSKTWLNVIVFFIWQKSDYVNYVGNHHELIIDNSIIVTPEICQKIRLQLACRIKMYLKLFIINNPSSIKYDFLHTMCNSVFPDTRGPFYLHGLTIISANMNNFTLNTVWNGIINPFANFNNCALWPLLLTWFNFNPSMDK